MTKERQDRQATAKRRGLLLVLVLALASMGLVGCEGAAETVETTETPAVALDDFEQAADTARDEVEATLESLRDVENVNDLASALEAGADRVADSTEPLERAEVPEDLEPAKEDFIQALEDFANEAEQTARNLDEGDPVQAFQDVRALDSLEHLQEAINDLHAAGVDVEQLSLLGS